ncbi:MAG: UDP-glucose/GDP-mannose dehydrogenase family protein [Acidobacteria bacterium]|nr:UDP-glucose/GDP-mannose dehydrogenase family protein [Acidobacteriota bacterium]
MSNLCVIGTGHVGLITACCFAELGHQVIAVDRDKGKLDRLRKSEAPFFEPGLQELLSRNITAGRLSFSGEIADGIRQAGIVFVCVGTPPLSDGRANLAYVEEVARSIAACMDDYRLIVEKSTVPVQTSQWIRRTVTLFNRTRVEFDVASNPEFLREGSAIEDFMRPDRVVIGAESERARRLLFDLYESFNCPVLLTDLVSAEMIKHASNAFLAMKISFINMVGNLCEKAGADVDRVAEGIGLDRRIGRAFLNAGIGYGGSCFPKDVKAFLNMAESLEVDFGLLREVDRLNEHRVDHLIRKAHAALWVLNDKTIGLLGLAFKPNTDDVREAPSLRVIERLRAEGSRLRLYDPQAEGNMRAIHAPVAGALDYCSSPEEAADGAEALMILTEADEFRKLDWDRIRRSMRTPIVIDGRNVLDPAKMAASGFEYYSIGRPSVGNRY